MTQNVPNPDVASRDYAATLDSQDELAPFRERFHTRQDQIYMDGNSLGLLSRDAEDAVYTALEQWKTLGIDGWMAADPQWFTLGEQLGEMTAEMVGAYPDEVVVTGTTTVNQHQLVSTFYRPDGQRRKIIATALDFPSDIYALQSQILLRGGDPESDLVRVESRDGRTIHEDDLIAAMTDDVALAVLPSVLYRSGQLFNIGRLTRAAHDAGILIGFDCAHSAGAVPHELTASGVDFAYWCNYKYLNSGPGSVGALYVNRQHHGTRPGLSGWWGYNKERQFDMVHEWESAPAAGAWQISTVPLLSTAPLIGSLKIFREAGMDRIRKKSLKQTEYMMNVMEASGLLSPPYGYVIGTPAEPERRGGHVAIEHVDAARIARALKQRGIIPDFREPNVVRLAPIALYTRYVDVWDVVQALKGIIDTGEYLEMDEGRNIVA
ncbi:MAG: kynureninase [Sphaerobacteraceae bacterium]|nr:MAG: kynureninase [Sphaerobacteraceae bacterium]